MPPHSQSSIRIYLRTFAIRVREGDGYPTRGLLVKSQLAERLQKRSQINNLGLAVLLSQMSAYSNIRLRR